ARRDLFLEDLHRLAKALRECRQFRCAEQQQHNEDNDDKRRAADIAKHMKIAPIDRVCRYLTSVCTAIAAPCLRDAMIPSKSASTAPRINPIAAPTTAMSPAICPSSYWAPSTTGNSTLTMSPSTAPTATPPIRIGP